MTQARLSTLLRCVQQALDQYYLHLRYEVDLSWATIRNYLGDVRLFIARREHVVVQIAWE